MDKSMINLVLLFLSLTFASCKNDQDKEAFNFTIDKPNEEKLISIKLKKIFPYQQMIILENTLNDTCKLGIMKIPPGKTGSLYKIEFFADSIEYKYTPVKAVTGKLIIEHSFSNY